MAGLSGLAAAARRVCRRRAVWLGALGATLLMLALLVGLAVADIDATTGPPSEPNHQFAFLGGATPSGAPTPPSRVHRGPAPAQATLTIGPSPLSTPVPSSFFGISTEYWALPQFERNTPVFERVLSLLHVAGDGPLVLRIGGDSADETFWSPGRHRMPGWVVELTPSYLARLRALVLRDRVKLIVDLNLVTANPLAAAAWAKAAEASLPRGSIVGFEIGNEPDLYSRRYWEATLARSPLQQRFLPLELTPVSYVQDFAAYAGALKESAPDIPLIGPAVAHPRLSLPFISTLIQDQRPELGAVTGHLYPYSACQKNPRARAYPTVARVLSREGTWAFYTDIASAVRTAHDAGLPFRLTELNSVTCGGKAGVSNTFATALWAPDALFTAMGAGADGANLHVRPRTINAAFTVVRGGLEPRPLLYGVMMFIRTLGPQARLVRLHLSAARSLNLSAWAVQVRGHILHLLLIDKGSRTVRVALHLPATATGTVQRLLAPSVYSRSGVTLNGQQLNYEADWIGTARTETIASGAHGGYELTVYRRSAALMSVRLGSRRAATARRRRPTGSEHHRRVSVTKHPVLAVGLDRPRKH